MNNSHVSQAINRPARWKVAAVLVAILILWDIDMGGSCKEIVPTSHSVSVTK